MIELMAEDNRRTVVFEATDDLEIKIKNSRDYLLSVVPEIEGDNKTLKFYSSELTSLPANTYYLELWVNNEGIYPSEGFLSFKVNDNVMRSSASTITTITMEWLDKQISDIKQSVSDKATNKQLNDAKADLNSTINSFATKKSDITYVDGKVKDLNKSIDDTNAQVNTKADKTDLETLSDNLSSVKSDVLSRPLGALDDTKIKGGNVSAWADYFDDISSAVSTLNLNTITPNVRVYSPDVSSSEVTVSNEDLTALETTLSRISKLTTKPKVIAEPYPFINNGAQAETFWNPNDIDKWFTNWEKAVIEVAKVAERYSTYGLYVGSNLEYMELPKYSSKWESLIANVRKVYSGKIIYRTNKWITATWDNDLTQKYQTNKRDNPIWGMVDIISIAAYFEITDTKNPSVDELTAGIRSVPYLDRRQNIFDEIKQIHDKWDKPIMFGELGIPPFDGAASHPYDSVLTEGEAKSDTIQSNWFEAWYKVFASQDWFLGFSIFCIADSSSNYNVEKGNVASFINKLEFYKASEPVITIPDTDTLKFTMKSAEPTQSWSYEWVGDLKKDNCYILMAFETMEDGTYKQASNNVYTFTDYGISCWSQDEAVEITLIFRYLKDVKTNNISVDLPAKDTTAGTPDNSEK